MAEVIGNHWSRGASWTKFVWSSICWICCERDKSKKLSELGWEKGPNWECTFAHRKQVGYSYEQKWGYSGSTKKSKEQSVLPHWWTYVISRMRSQAELVKNYRGIIVHQRPHRSETNGIAERSARRIKEGTSAVLSQSGLNEKWWADSMECDCYLQKRSRPPGGWENTLRKAIRRTIEMPNDSFFGSNGWMLSEICWRPVMAPPIWQDSFTWKVPRLCSNRGENVERRCSGRRHWGAGKFGRVRNPRRLKCKVITPQLGEQLHIPSRWWKIQTVCAIVWKKPWIPKIHFRAGSTCKKRRAQWRLSRKFGQVSTKRRSNVRRSSPWRFLVDRKELHLSSSRRTSGSTPRAERRKHSQFYWNIYWRDQDHAHKSDVLQESRTNRYLSDSRTGFTLFTPLNENLPAECVGPGSGWQKFKQLPDRIIRPETSSKMSKAAQRKEKQQWAFENRSSTMRERREASILSIRMIKSSKKPWKNAREVNKFQWKPLCLVSWRRHEEFAPASGKQTADPTKSKNQSMHAS